MRAYRLFGNNFNIVGNLFYLWSSKTRYFRLYLFDYFFIVMMSPFALSSFIKNMFFHFVCILCHPQTFSSRFKVKSSFDTQKVQLAVEHILPNN